MAWEDPQQFGDPQDESFLSSIAHTALSPLVYLGESLSKPGYAVRGLLAGQGPSSLLNLIPFSDAMGITNPEEHVTGRDLARKMGWADQEDTWGNFFGGLGLDILTDPLSALSFGGKALTTEGLQALKQGTLASTRAARIAEGQSGLLGLHTPFWAEYLGLPKGQMALGTGDTAQYLAGLMDKGGSALANVPGVNYLRSMFDASAGHTTDARVQQGVSEVGSAPAQAFNAKYRQQLLPYISMQQKADSLMQAAGMSAEDSATQWGKLTNMHGEGTPVPTDLMQGYKGVDSIDLPNLHGQVGDLAEQAGKGVGAIIDAARREAMESGVVVPEMQDVFRNYLPQRGIGYGNTLKSQQQSRSLIAPLGGGANELNDIALNEKVMLQNGQSVPLAGLKSSAGWDKAAYDELIANKAEEFAARDLQKQTELLNAGGLSAPQEEYLRGLSEAKIKANALDRANYFAELSPDVVQAGRGIYDPDLMARATNYVNNLAQQVKTSQGITNTLAREALPVGSAQAANADRGAYMTAGEALDRLKVNAKDVVDQGGSEVYSSGGRPSLINRLAELGKLQAPADMEVGNVKDLLDGMLVKKDLVSSLTKEAAGSGQGSAFGRMLDSILTPYKSFVTAFPGTHARTNLDQMVLQPWLQGVGSFENAANAEKYLAGALPEGAMNQTAQQAFVHGAALDKQYLGQIGEQALTRGSGLQTIFPQQSAESSLIGGLRDFFKGYAGKEGESYLSLNPDKNPFVQRSLEAHNTQGNAARLTQFQGLLDQGYKPEVAARLTNLGQIDYANQLTDFEKTVMRRVMPFYNFSKGSALRFADQLQDPGKTSALLQLMTSGAQKNVVPNYVSPGAAIPIPGAEEGSQRYISGFGLPQENEAILGLVSMLHGDVGGGMRKILSGVNPLAQIAIEQGTGQQIFTGRPLDELHPSSIASLGGLLPNRLAVLAQEVLGATPAARVTSTLDKALGGRDVDPILNALLGIRTTDINNQTAAKYGAEDALRQMLMDTGEAKRRSDVYLPAANRENASPRAQYLYQLLNEVQRSK